MNITAIAKMLYPGLRKLLEKLGRWVVEKLRRFGVAVIFRIIRKGIKRLRKRVRKIKLKLVRSESFRKIGRLARRLAWVTDRLRNWRGTLDWFAQREAQLSQKVADRLNEMTDGLIDYVAPAEKFSQWNKFTSPTNEEIATIAHYQKGA